MTVLGGNPCSSTGKFFFERCNFVLRSGQNRGRYFPLLELVWYIRCILYHIMEGSQRLVRIEWSRIG
jgi:hypothetical protein